MITAPDGIGQSKKKEKIMLTVKWKYRFNGCEVERLFQADQVTAAFRNGDPTKPVAQVTPLVQGRPVERAVVIIDGYDLGGSSFNCGKVYVMNDRGSTVASYDLGDGEIFESSIPVPAEPALAA